MRPLNHTDLAALLTNGENSGVEFKRDAVSPESLAKELVALGNFEGGVVLLGVEDDGTVSGLRYSPERTGRKIEEWVMNVCRQNVRPSIIPFFQILPDVVPDCDVAVIQIGRGLGVLQNSNGKYYIRTGSVSAEMTTQELARLFQQRGQVRAEVQPVSNSTLSDLHLGRLTDYFERVRQQPAPALADVEGWQRILLNTELMAEADNGGTACSVAGLLLFGRAPNRLLPQAGITAAAFPGTEKEYVTPQRLRGPLVSLFQVTESRTEVIEPGVIDRAMAFVEQHATDPPALEGAVRTQQWHYPREAVREAIVNAVAHRDYLLSGTDIELSLYADRLEIISPGHLPNGITPARMRQGCRASRNQLLTDTLRDYGYMEHMGLGVPRKIIRLMRAHNGTEPEFVAEDTRLIVRLWRYPKSTDSGF